ncbi:MAG: 4-hydroxy-3-methylbut-2-enyl diphosphate reductase [Paludibacteraceae bacterium]|nr:4-hydroxy-3-methylbut-2-enyl diphosphate reductase [Paludibacteraceae bacterium]
MRIEIDEHSGFCFGVTSAISKAEEILQSRPLYCLGDIVHNGEEIKRLAERGLVTINYDQMAEFQGVDVLFRAHGEPPSTYDLAKKNNIHVVDATCPVVLHLQKQIKDIYVQHPQSQILIFGKRGHAEVVGLQGQTNNNAIVIEQEEDLKSIDFERDIFLFSQTTMSVEKFEHLVQCIEQKIAPNATFHYFNTICKSVANRMQQLQNFAKNHDMIIFVGGKKSSNAKELFGLCKKMNDCSFFIANEEEITDEMQQIVQQKEQIGICGATSTPLWLMEKCKNKIENYGLSN